MRAWLLLLGGLLVWAVHFFGIYAAGEIGGETHATKILIAIWTMLALVADGVIMVTARPRAGGLSGWIRAVAFWSAGLSAIAVLWQGLSILGASH